MGGWSSRESVPIICSRISDRLHQQVQQRAQLQQKATAPQSAIHKKSGEQPPKEKEKEPTTVSKRTPYPVTADSVNAAKQSADGKRKVSRAHVSSMIATFLCQTAPTICRTLSSHSPDNSPTGSASYVVLTIAPLRVVFCRTTATNPRALQIALDHSNLPKCTQSQKEVGLNHTRPRRKLVPWPWAWFHR